MSFDIGIRYTPDDHKKLTFLLQQAGDILALAAANELLDLSSKKTTASSDKWKPIIKAAHSYKNPTLSRLVNDLVTRQVTAFTDFDALLQAGGTYHPALSQHDNLQVYLAEQYDAAQMARGDSRRALVC